MAISGHNGNNETFIGMSFLNDLSFYDNDLNEIKITKSQSPIDIMIHRDTNLPEYSYQYVNTTQLKLSSLFLPNGFNITANNVSIHIELKPMNFKIGYFMVLKLGYTPIINSTYSDYDSFKLICPGNFSLIAYL